MIDPSVSLLLSITKKYYRGNIMSIYRLKGIPVLPIFKIATLINMVIGGCGGLLVGMAEGDLIGIIGGLFLGFLFGIASGMMYTFYAFLFNILAPMLGGIELCLEKADPFLDSLEQPIPLVSPPPQTQESNNHDIK
jgi:hypothetical protein